MELKVKFAIYIIFYFGDKKNKEQLLKDVQNDIPSDYKDKIKVVCIDLTYSDIGTKQ